MHTCTSPSGNLPSPTRHEEGTSEEGEERERERGGGEKKRAGKKIKKCYTDDLRVRLSNILSHGTKLTVPLVASSASGSGG